MEAMVDFKMVRVEVCIGTTITKRVVDQLDVKSDSIKNWLPHFALAST